MNSLAGRILRVHEFADGKLGDFEGKEHFNISALLAGDQWWPFAFCTRNYEFVATQIWPVYKRKQK